MVKFQIMSDLHLETMDNNDISALDFITPTAQVLILAGDIGKIHKHEQLEKFLKDLCRHFQIVLYVIGNHEYYKVENNTDNVSDTDTADNVDTVVIEQKTMSALLLDMYNIAKNIPNLHILEKNNSVIIEDVCIVGCTLWSQPLIHVPKFIVKVECMTTSRYESLHNEDVKYIKNMIDYASDNNLKLLVVTHHCPTYSCLKASRKTDKYRSLYASDLDYLLSSCKVHTWVCGHVHTNFDFITEGGTRVVSNQKGKPKDKVPDFSLEKIIEV